MRGANAEYDNKNKLRYYVNGKRATNRDPKVPREKPERRERRK